MELSQGDHHTSCREFLGGFWDRLGRQSLRSSRKRPAFVQQDRPRTRLLTRVSPEWTSARIRQHISTTRGHFWPRFLQILLRSGLAASGSSKPRLGHLPTCSKSMSNAFPARGEASVHNSTRRVRAVGADPGCFGQKSMPPDGIGGTGASFFGFSATIASVVISSPAIEAASCSAVRTTLTGSITPCS